MSAAAVAAAAPALPLLPLSSQKVRALLQLRARPMAAWGGGHACVQWCGALPMFASAHACGRRAGWRSRGRLAPGRRRFAAAAPCRDAAAAALACMPLFSRKPAPCARATAIQKQAASNARGRVLPPPAGFALLPEQPSYQHFARGLPLVALSRMRRTLLNFHSTSPAHPPRQQHLLP